MREAMVDQEGDLDREGDRHRSADEAIRLLLSGGERWGWAADDPSRFYRWYAVPKPVPQLPPPPGAGGEASAVSTRRRPSRLFGIRASWYFLSGVVVLFVGAAIETGTGARGTTTTSTTLSVVVWALWGLSIVAVLRHRRRASGAHRPGWFAQRAFERSCRAASAEWERAVRGWEYAKQQHDADETARVRQLPLYQPVTFVSRPRRVDVFGEAGCWPDFLATLGASLLGSGNQVTLLDFSQAGASTRLVALCAEAGMTARVLTFPDDAARCDMLAGLSPAGITDVIIESLYSGSDPASAEQRALASRLVGEVTEILAPRITMARLWRGVRVAMGHESAAAARGELGETDWQRLHKLFPRPFRATVAERLVRLEHQLHTVRGLGTAVPDESPPAPLECFVAGSIDAHLEKELLRDLVVERTLRLLRHRDEAHRPHVLIVAGVDHLTEPRLRRLDQQAEASDSRLILLFRGLSSNALTFAGSGGAVAFFRLPNADQAEQAADWIGRDHRFVLGEFTEERARLQVSRQERSHSSTSSQRRLAQGGLGVSATPTQPVRFFLKAGVNETTFAAATETEASLSVEAVAQRLGTRTQRVYEHVVDAVTLRGLPPNTLLLAEFDPVSGRRVVAADCSPELALDARVKP
jgi:hypothetical protein